MRKYVISGLLLLSLVMPTLMLAEDVQTEPVSTSFFQELARGFRLQMLELQSAVARVVTGKPSSCIELTKDLKRGQRDSQVNKLQQYLAKEGYFTGKVDGYFATTTEDGVKQFQVSKGLFAANSSASQGFGIVGKETREKIRDLSCGGSANGSNGSNPTPQPNAPTSTQPNPTQSPTSTGPIPTSPTASSSVFQVTVTSPMGGETLKPNDIVNIRWSVKNASGTNVATNGDLYLISEKLFDSRVTNPLSPLVIVRQVKPQSADASSYAWTVGKISSGKAIPEGSYFLQVCVSGFKNKGACGLSSGAFTVKADLPPVLSSVSAMPRSVASGQQVRFSIVTKNVKEYSFTLTCPKGVTSTNKDGGGCGRTRVFSSDVSSYSARFTNTAKTAQRVRAIVEVKGLLERPLKKSVDIIVQPASKTPDTTTPPPTNAPNNTPTKGTPSSTPAGPGDSKADGGGDRSGGIWDDNKAI